jgi:2-polyprenyl-3-methyl-5-hydroxy-6-metoxy-1,4-benzoquinol methylase
MTICKSCGFVSYSSKYKSEDEIKKHYEKDARTTPNVRNIYTGQSKIHYHEAMLGKIIAKWNEEGKHIKVFETGSAIGIFLNWLKHKIKKCDVSGSEWAIAYRRVAFHEYGIELKEDFDYTQKYDLICSYKVAEHMLDADKKLRSYVECLNEDGI